MVRQTKNYLNKKDFGFKVTNYSDFKEMKKLIPEFEGEFDFINEDKFNEPYVFYPDGCDFDLLKNISSDCEILDISEFLSLEYLIKSKKYAVQCLSEKECDKMIELIKSYGVNTSDGSYWFLDSSHTSLVLGVNNKLYHGESGYMKSEGKKIIHAEYYMNDEVKINTIKEGTIMWAYKVAKSDGEVYNKNISSKWIIDKAGYMINDYGDKIWINEDTLTGWYRKTDEEKFIEELKQIAGYITYNDKEDLNLDSILAKYDIEVKLK